MTEDKTRQGKFKWWILKIRECEGLVRMVSSEMILDGMDLETSEMLVKTIAMLCSIDLALVEMLREERRIQAVEKQIKTNEDHHV